MKKQELLDKLQNSEELVKVAFLPLSEVIAWVEELEVEAKLSKEKIDQIAIEIADKITQEGADLVDDFSVSIDYDKTICLDDISLDERNIADIVKDVFSSEFEAYS